MISSSKLHNSVAVFVAALLALLVAAYSGLIALGRWQLDEYKEFYQMRSEQHYLLHRLTWSPRPLSEPIYIVYGWTVNHVHQQLIVPLLAILWSVLLVATFTTAIQKKPQRRSSRLPILLLSLVLLTATLSSGAITEVFYWPAGAVAYIPTLAASLLLFLQTVDGHLETRRGRIVAALCLIVAAGTSETGATFVLCYGAVQTFQRLREPRTAEEKDRSFLFCVPAFLLAMAVTVTVCLNRFRTTSVITGTTTEHKGLIHLVIRGLEQIVTEVVGHDLVIGVIHDHGTSKLRLLLQVISETHLWSYGFLFVGIALLWYQMEPVSLTVRRDIANLVVAFALSVVGVLAASLLQFGTACCERHELLRDSWMVMIVAGLAILFSSSVAHRLPRIMQQEVVASLLVLLAVLSLRTLGPLTVIYRSFASVRATGQQNAASGFARGRSGMSFTVLPQNPVIREEPVPTGAYTRPRTIKGFGYEVYPDYLMGFFDKQKVEIHESK